MDLKELLGEELYKQVKEKLGDKKVIINNDGSYLPKSKFDEKNEEVKLLKEKLTAHEKQAKDTETLLKDNAELKTKFEALQTESKTQLEARDKQISHITKKTALSRALAEKKAKHADLLMKEFDFDKIELDGEKIKDFDKLIAPLTEKYADMFEIKKVEGGGAPNKGTFGEGAAENYSWMDNIK
jgi:hypothetical protein